jgi:hypothetical protein
MDSGRKVLEGAAPEVLADPRSLDYGISVPPISKLYSQLTSDGLVLPRYPSSPEEMADEVNGL